LVRCKNPDTGELIPPNEFIPVAIETGYIDKIDLQVIEKAIIQYQEWLKKGYNPGVLSCNVTIYELEKTDFENKIKAILDKYNFNPVFLNIEVTEESVMRNAEISIKMLEKINKLGIKINVDDFGTGYSSLSYLKKLPISKIKIDREFIKDIPYDKDDVIITKTIINLAKNMGLGVIAEGVENEIQKNFVFENGCDYVQGFYYSKPVPADEFEKKFLSIRNK
jgi:EAL domain-containing protein (putative c-di-GMP-specific phosphodiesterase class I)